jgi:hypothetical protein
MYIIHVMYTMWNEAFIGKLKCVSRTFLGKYKYRPRCSRTYNKEVCVCLYITTWCSLSLYATVRLTAVFIEGECYKFRNRGGGGIFVVFPENISALLHDYQNFVF